MKKTVKMGDQSVDIQTSAGWLFVYYENFGRDIMADLVPLLYTVSGLAFETGRSIVGGKKESEIKNLKEANLLEIINHMDQQAVEDAIASLSALDSITLLKIFWALAKNYDDSIPDVKEWLNSFEVCYMDEVMPQIFDGILEAMASSKKYQSLRESLKTFLSPSQPSWSEGSREDLISKA